MSEDSKTESVTTSVWVFCAVCAGLFGVGIFGVYGLDWPLAVTVGAVGIVISFSASCLWPGKESATGGGVQVEDEMDQLSGTGGEPHTNINGMPMIDKVDCLGNTYGSDFHPDD